MRFCRSQDMDADPYLKSAGISSDWPIGRGCYVSADKGFIIWVGEEDHLRECCARPRRCPRIAMLFRSFPTFKFPCSRFHVGILCCLHASLACMCVCVCARTCVRVHMRMRCAVV